MTDKVDKKNGGNADSSGTGQTLPKSNLEPGDHSQFLPIQHRNGYHHEDSEDTIDYRYPTVAPRTTLISCDDDKRAKENHKKLIGIITICVVIFIIVLILGIAAVGYKFHLAAQKITTNYSGAVTTNSPIYSVNRNDIHRYEKVTYRYKQIGVTISTTGLYRFECDTVDFPPFVYIGTIDLYRESFDAGNLTMNQLPYKYSGAGIHKSFFDVSLRSRNYILVVSVIDAYEKSFSILITGPASVTFS